LKPKPLRLCSLVALAVGLTFAPGAARAAVPASPVAWGCGSGQNWGQCTVPASLAGRVTAIDAAYYHSLALKNDGTVVAWGCGSGSNFGQCTVPGGLTGVTAISSGFDQNLALRMTALIPPGAAASSTSASAACRAASAA
jgi:hypothetical protein